MRFDETPADDPDSLALLAEYFEERANGFLGGGYSVARVDPAAFAHPAGAFVVAVDDGGPIGCGGVKSIGADESGRERFEVKHLYVRPSARGTGTGRRLLEDLEQRAVRLGARRLVLDTNASLVAAGSLYRSSGYVETAPYNDNPNATHWYSKDID